MKNLILLLFLIVSVSGYSQLNTNNAILTGRSRLYFGNYTGAIESFNMVIKMKPYLPEPYYYRGVSKIELNDFRGAKKDLDKAIEIKPFFPEALMYRGIANHNLKEYSLAMDDYSKAMELDGENADIFNNRGICKASLRDFKGAIEDYNRSIELKPKNFNAYLNRSIAYQMQKEWDKAIADCNQLIRIRPNSPMGYMSRGLVKIEKEDFASALRDFDVAISYDPNNAFAFQNRGMVKQQLESYEAAVMDYDAALKIDPYMASAYFNRGIAKEMLGRDGYQKDYDNASLLDARFAKRPWQTTEERDKAQQQQLQAWKQQQKQVKGKNQANIEATTDSLNSTADKAAQIDRDDLRKRKMKANLALEDNREIPGIDENERGRIQDKNIDISLLPDFKISTIDKKLAENEDVGYFNLVIENLNALNNYDPYLTITNRPNETEFSLEFFKNQILIFDERIRQNGEIPVNFLYRGIFEALSKQFNKAIDDFDKVIKLDERSLLAYFMRANARTQMIETIERLKLNEQSTGISLNRPVDSKTNSISNDAYNEIFTDYSVIVYMNPDFIFGYYNRGNVYCKTEKYFQAIEEYNKAITIEPEFAEAYYNRGLVKILLNDVESGAKDLSKAGELGIAEAYNVIKRYCN